MSCLTADCDSIIDAVALIVFQQSTIPSRSMLRKMYPIPRRGGQDWRKLACILPYVLVRTAILSPRADVAWSAFNANMLQDDGGSMFEEDVLCLLDFYIHEPVQRKGLGIALFSSALKVGTGHLLNAERALIVFHPCCEG